MCNPCGRCGRKHVDTKDVVYETDGNVNGVVFTHCRACIKVILDSGACDAVHELTSISDWLREGE